MTDQARITRLVGVYDADHTLRGELAYWVGARLGRAHCSLCDITHGLVREREDWRACRDGLPVPFETFHRDDQPESVRTVIGAALPAVVADTTAGLQVLLDPAALDACQGDPQRLVDALTRAADQHGLTW